MSGSGAQSRSSYRMKRATTTLGFTKFNAHGTPQLVQGNMARQRTESVSYFSPNVYRGGTVVSPATPTSPRSVSSLRSNPPSFETVLSTSDPSASGIIEYAPIVATPSGSLQRPSIITTPIDEPDQTPTFNPARSTQLSHSRPGLGFVTATTQILSRTFSSPTSTSKESTWPTLPTPPISPTALTMPKPAITRGNVGTTIFASPRSHSRTKTSWTISKVKRNGTVPRLKRHDSGSVDKVKTIGGPRYEASPDPPRHRPSTGQQEQCVYVLTLKTDEEVSDPVNRMRKTWFPTELNRTPAHLTFFHALPHSQVELVKRDLGTLSAKTKPFQVGVGRAFRLRRGVGINLGSGVKKASFLHDALRSAWLNFLSEQDRGPWRPHWTVQNKEDDEGRRNNAMLDVETIIRREDVAGKALGLDLWKYDYGNWILEKEFEFGGSAINTWRSGTW